MNEPLHVAMIERDYGGTDESSASAVSWPAIIAGAFVATALSLSLVALGSGLGLLSVSPWENAGASGKTIGIATAIWLGVMELVSASIGGYLAGRLRTKWVDARTDEVFFRDTAHGFLVWAVGLVITAAFLTSTASSLVGSAAKVGATAFAGGAGGAVAATPTATSSVTGTANPSAYFVDRLLRGERRAGQASEAGATGIAAPTPATAPPSASETSERASDAAAARAELARVFATALSNGRLNPEDRAYIALVVASRTGMSQTDAEKRVDDVVEQARAATNAARAVADEARSAGAYFSLWVFVSLLIGAFGASYFATVGGRQRDRVSP